MIQENMTSTSSSQPGQANPGLQEYDSREGERRVADRRKENSRDGSQHDDAPSNPDINADTSDSRIYVHEEKEKNEGLANRSVSGRRAVPSESEENSQVKNTTSESDPNIHG